MKMRLAIGFGLVSLVVAAAWGCRVRQTESAAFAASAGGVEAYDLARQRLAEYVSFKGTFSKVEQAGVSMYTVEFLDTVTGVTNLYGILPASDSVLTALHTIKDGATVNVRGGATLQSYTNNSGATIKVSNLLALSISEAPKAPIGGAHPKK